MKIALITVGTRGDVQPYVAVGAALRERGHEVVLGAADEFAPMARAYGLEHRRVGSDFRDLLRTDLGRAWLTSADAPLKYARYARELFVPLQRAWCEDADRAVEGCDGVAFYAMAAGGLYAAERRKIPAVVLSPWPIEPSRDLPPVSAVWLERAPPFVRYALGHAFLRMGFGSMTQAHEAYRAGVGLPGLRAKDFFHHILDRKTPSVHLFSESVLRRPRDWGAHHAVAGFAFVPPQPFTPPAALDDFLSAGPPPIYMGFGSMTGYAPEEFADLAARAARLASVRAVVASGWAGLQPRVTDDLCVVDEVPHDWLFPRVRAVVHHGGVGTFAEGLRAGRPTVIAAFFGDQPFWGRLNERLGTGPRALRREHIRAEALAAAIREAVSDPRYLANAQRIGERLRAENGAARAASLIERECSLARSAPALARR